MSIIQLLVKSVATVLSLRILFRVRVAIIIPSFALSARNVWHHDPPSADSAGQRLEQCVHARTSHVWSTLVAFEWLDRKLSLIECQITICS